MKITWPGFYLGFVLLAVAPLAVLSLAGLAGAFSASGQQIKDYSAETVDDAEVETAKAEVKYLNGLAKELARPYEDQQCAELPDTATSELKSVDDTWDDSFGKLRELLGGGTGVLAEDPAEATKTELERIEGKLKDLADELRTAQASGVGGIERLTGFIQKRQDTVGDYICIKEAEELYARETYADYESCAKKLQDREWIDSEAEDKAQRLLTRAKFEARVIELREKTEDLIMPANDTWEPVLDELKRFLSFEFPKSPDPLEQRGLDKVLEELTDLYAGKKGSYEFYRMDRDPSSMRLDERVDAAHGLVEKFPNSKKLRNDAHDAVIRWLREGLSPRRMTVDENLRQAKTPAGHLIVGVFVEQFQMGEKSWKYWRTSDEMKTNPQGFRTIHENEIKWDQGLEIAPVRCIQEFNRELEHLQMESNLTQKGAWEAFRDYCTKLQKELDEYRRRAGRPSEIKDFYEEKSTAERVLSVWDVHIRPLLAG